MLQKDNIFVLLQIEASDFLSEKGNIPRVSELYGVIVGDILLAVYKLANCVAICQH